MNQLAHRDDCRLCGSRTLDMVMRLTPTPPGDMYLPPAQAAKASTAYPLDLYLCRDCGYANLLDILDPDSIYKEYIYTTTSSPGLIKHFEGYARHVVERLRLPSGSLAVDMGSNDGALLRELKKVGMRVVGVEPSPEIAAAATKEGLPTLNRYFDAKAVETIRNDHGSANLVTANNVFANIDDVSTVVDNVKTLLAPGGVFVVEFAYLGDLIKNRIFDYIYHEHLSYFSVDALRRMFVAKDMKIVGVEHVETKGGSVRIYVQRASDAPALADNLDSWIAAEDHQRLRDPETYRALLQTVDETAASCRALLDKYKSEKRRIVGYGASVTCTTLIYHFGLAKYLDVLVDDNAAKIGTVCPGLGIDVRPSSALDADGQTVVVVLAWRFADMIIERNRDVLSRGGVFVVPMPELKLVDK